MKKIIVLLLIVSSFFIGRITMYQNEYDKMCNAVEKIKDWNTNGEELSILTEDDYEFYAYK